jgi:hypothetical protein
VHDQQNFRSADHNRPPVNPEKTITSAIPLRFKRIEIYYKPSYFLLLFHPEVSYKSHLSYFNIRDTSSCHNNSIPPILDTTPSIQAI